MNKIVRTIEAMQGETVRIRWFLPMEGGYYDEEYTCLPFETRKAREDEKRERCSSTATSESETDTN